MSVFERMTYKIYPHPPNYFVTLSKLKESRFFSYHPPTFSDNVTLYDVFFLDGVPYQAKDKFHMLFIFSKYFYILGLKSLSSKS